MYITAPEPISTTRFINHFHQSVRLYVCLYLYVPTVAKQKLGENVTAATNTHATIEELLGASFYMRSVTYERKVGHQFSQLLV
jgi:hypothetical protein